GDRPGGRDAVVVADLAEVLGAQPVERRPVELRRAADEVMDLRLERLAGLVVPRLGRDVAVVDEDVGRLPVLRLPRRAGAARASSRMRLPDGARWRASVPPPAPVPTMITSYVSMWPPLVTPAQAAPPMLSRVRRPTSAAW